jgi:hypothetical protein
MGKAKERLERLLEDLNTSTGPHGEGGVAAAAEELGEDENDYPCSEFSSISDVTGASGDGSDDDAHGGHGGGHGGGGGGRGGGSYSGSAPKPKDAAKHNRRVADALIGAGTVYTGRLEQKVQQRTAKLEERLAAGPSPHSRLFPHSAPVHPASHGLI